MKISGGPGLTLYVIHECCLNNPTHRQYSLPWCTTLYLSAKSHTHPCSLYESTGFSFLSLRRLTHWYIFIYKGIISKLPSYLSDLLSQMHSSYSFRSNNFIRLDTPRTLTKLGKTALNSWLPGCWTLDVTVVNAFSVFQCVLILPV